MRLALYKYNIGDVLYFEKRNLVILDRWIAQSKSNNKHHEKRYKCKCLKCGYISEYAEKYVTKGRCACCKGVVVVKGINDIPTTDPWMVDYFQGGYDEACQYTSGSCKKLLFKCPDCGTINSDYKSIYSLKSNRSCGCKNCAKGMSFGERFIKGILQQNNIEFVHEYNKKHANWINNNFRYDFYLPKYNTIIEVHGNQHYHECYWSNSRNIAERDTIKKELALNNGVNFIEIDARKSTIEWMRQSVLNSDLANIIDLSNINFDFCYHYAYKGKIEECKMLLNEYPYYHAEELRVKLDVSQIELYRILHILNWKIPTFGDEDMIDVYYDGKFKRTWCSYSLLKSEFYLEFGININIIITPYLDTDKVYKQHFTFKRHDRLLDRKQYNIPDCTQFYQDIAKYSFNKRNSK